MQAYELSHIIQHFLKIILARDYMGIFYTVLKANQNLSCMFTF